VVVQEVRTANTQAGTIKTNDWMDDSFVYFDQCAREDVRVTGKFHLVQTISTDGSITTIQFHDNGPYVGIGLTSGTLIHWGTAGKETDVIDAAPPFVFSAEISVTQTGIAKGSGLYNRFHVITSFYYDGTSFTIVDRKFVFECREIRS
jgi:hypothetical protein